MLTNIKEVKLIAHEYLIWVVISPLVSIWSYMLDGIFIGATRSSEMRKGMIISLIIFIVITILLKPSMGYMGVWIAFIIFMIMRGVTLGVFYPRIEADAKQA